MARFERKFSVGAITDSVQRLNPWFADLLMKWRPAGDALAQTIPLPPQGGVEPKPSHLRLAVRNGYLNFYRNGQSVARVWFGKSGLKAELHNKYVFGSAGQGRTLYRLEEGSLGHRATGYFRAYGGPDDLEQWMKNADTLSGDEKRFVDLVVAHNANTIDFEMALPAVSPARVASRMDLVALEPFDDRWRIVFWEAKLVRDDRIRCRGADDAPDVIRQLDQYASCLRHDDNGVLVAQAYQNACRVLVGMHRLARSVNPGINGLGPGIVAAAAPDALPLLIDDQPRLLIANCTGDESFEGNGHLAKLRNRGRSVQLITPATSMALKAAP